MQSIRAFVGPVELRSFPMHSIARQARCDVEWVTLVGPPSIHAQSKILPMCVPVTACLLFIKLCQAARIVNRSSKFVRQDDIMEHDVKIIFVQLGDHFGRIREYARIPGERPILGVPTGCAESGAEIDEGVAGKHFFTESSSLGEHFLSTCECAMRLLISKAPERRQFRVACQANVFGQNDGGICGYNEKQVE